MSDIDSNRPEKIPVESSPGAKPRRRFVRGVGAVVPATLTVWSASARSTLSSKTCLSPSASASITLLNSRPNRKRDDCYGRTPGYWMNQGADKAKSYKFSVIGTGFGDKTMFDVISLQGNGDKWQLGAHLSAAYLNLVTGKVPSTVLNLADLQAMWAGQLGSYSPTPNVFWDGGKIVEYLKTTMPL